MKKKKSYLTPEVNNDILTHLFDPILIIYFDFFVM